MDIHVVLLSTFTSEHKAIAFSWCGFDEESTFVPLFITTRTAAHKNT